MNTGVNHKIPSNTEDFLTNWRTASLSRRTLCHSYSVWHLLPSTGNIHYFSSSSSFYCNLL